MNRTDKIAQKLLDNWQAKAPYESLTGDLAPQSLADAYAAQGALQLLHTQRRGPVAGRKIALSAKVMQQMVGLDQPIAGAFFARDVLHSPARVAADDFVRLGLEFELAIELNADIAPQTAAHTSQSVAGCIAAVRPAFELIEDRAADYQKLDAHTLVADNAWCGGVVLGDVIADWQNMDLADIPSRVVQSGVEDEHANTGAADPLGSLAWVLNHFVERGLTLSKGEQIITGSALRTRFPVPGDAFTYHVAAASVQVEIV
ncbi:MAG: hypothetical protein ABJM29_20715 [Rhizobiaceae bacterium]